MTLTPEVTNRNMDHDSMREEVPKVEANTIDNQVNEVVDVSDEEESEDEEVISQREL